jgi:hypothetical protein
MSIGHALRPGPVIVGWFLTVGVDLFFNAGLFSPLFDQDREPSLLPDEVLFRRIPVAYLALAVGVVAVAFLLDELDLRGAVGGAVLGGTAGLVFGFLGVIGLWTAVDMTGVFVAAAVVVQVIEFALAGAFLALYREAPSRRLSLMAVTVAGGLAIGGIVVQNLLGA